MVTNSASNIKTATSGKVLQGQGIGVANDFSTATYPSTATGTGKILRADGTNWAATTATYPDTSGSSANVLTSDGTNWVSSTPLIIQKNWTLTNTQIKNLHGTPVELLAAPGTGKINIVISSVGKLIYGGSTPFVAAASQTVGIYYTTVTFITTALSNASITASNNAYTFLVASAALSGASTSFENIAINLYNPMATEITGDIANDSTMSGSIFYYVANL